MLRHSQFFLYLAVSSTSATIKWSKCERNAIFLADIGECLSRYGSVTWCPGLYSLWRAFVSKHNLVLYHFEQYKSDFYGHTSPCHWDRLRATKFVLTIFYYWKGCLKDLFFLFNKGTKREEKSTSWLLSMGTYMFQHDASSTWHYQTTIATWWGIIYHLWLCL